MSTTIAEPKATAKEMTIRDHLRSPSMIAELGKAMPQHCKPDRMARVALTALTRTPKLNDCTQASFFKCLLDLSAWGLEPDGRRAHLIPYGKECTLVIDYKGLVELAYRSGVVSDIHADVVREGDIFEYDVGEVIHHVPHYLRRDKDKPKEEGAIYAAYSKVKKKDGTTKSEVMSVKEIQAIQKRSKAGTNGPWVTDWSEMAKKTVFRRLSKWLPLSAEIQDGRTIQDADDDRIVDGEIAPPKESPSTLQALTEQLQRQEEAVADAPAKSPEYMRLHAAILATNEHGALVKLLNDQVNGHGELPDDDVNELMALGQARLETLKK